MTDSDNRVPQVCFRNQPVGTSDGKQRHILRGNIMKKWKYLLKVVMAVGVIAMTAVQICTAAEGTAQAAVSEVTPVSISTNEISGWPAGPEITSETGVLMDADSGTLLYSKGGDEIRSGCSYFRSFLYFHHPAYLPPLSADLDISAHKYSM